MPEVLLLSDDDFRPLREDPAYAGGPIDCVERAIRAHDQGKTRFQGIVDRNPGEFEGLRVALAAGTETYTGLRLFGNPPHTRAFMLFDGTTRSMLALMDYGVLNSLRVGAIAGVAAKYLAPKGAKVMGLLGSGWQAPPQVQSILNGVPGLELIRVYSPTRANRESFAARMSQIHGIAVEPAESIEEAVHGADIVDLCAPGHFDVKEPLLEIPWVKPGALVISMAASQLTEEFVLHARVATVNWNSLTAEPSPRPPYDGLINKGLFSMDDVTELGPVMDGKADPRRTPDDIVIYDLTGGNVHDLFLATWAYEWAKKHSLGLTFKLTGEELPRDL